MHQLATPPNYSLVRIARTGVRELQCELNSPLPPESELSMG